MLPRSPDSRLHARAGRGQRHGGAPRQRRARRRQRLIGPGDHAARDRLEHRPAARPAGSDSAGRHPGAGERRAARRRRQHASAPGGRLDAAVRARGRAARTRSTGGKRTRRLGLYEQRLRAGDRHGRLRCGPSAAARPVSARCCSTSAATTAVTRRRTGSRASTPSTRARTSRSPSTSVCRSCSPTASTASTKRSTPRSTTTGRATGSSTRRR